MKTQYMPEIFERAALSREDIDRFQKLVLGYYRAHGRRLPWRQTRDPYCIMISEVMLQQTQVLRVVPKYERFLELFPDAARLARAKNEELLGAWQGLGYNRRALMLKKAATAIHDEYKGRFPRSFEKLVQLPGIGPYTASAICVFAFNQPRAFVETNIRTVYIHCFFPEAAAVADDLLLPLIAQTQYEKNPRRWYNALMDYGVLLKQLYPNPGRKSVHYTKQSRFEGSDRQIRGEIIRLLLVSRLGRKTLVEKTGKDEKRVLKILAGLVAEGLVHTEKDSYKL